MTHRKTARLNIKVLESDKRALKRMAENEGEAFSVVVRRILRDKLKKKGYLKMDTNTQREKNGG